MTITLAVFIAFLLCVSILICNHLAFKAGYQRGKLEALESSMKATKDMIELLSDAQKEAGVTEEQLEKINDHLRNSIVGKVQKVVDAQ